MNLRIVNTHCHTTRAASKSSACIISRLSGPASPYPHILSLNASTSIIFHALKSSFLSVIKLLKLFVDNNSAIKFKPRVRSDQAYKLLPLRSYLRCVGGNNALRFSALPFCPALLTYRCCCSKNEYHHNRRRKITKTLTPTINS